MKPEEAYPIPLELQSSLSSKLDKPLIAVLGIFAGIGMLYVCQLAGWIGIIIPTIEYTPPAIQTQAGNGEIIVQEGKVATAKRQRR